MRRVLLVPTLAVATLGIALPASADPIQVTGGYYFLNSGDNGEWRLQSGGSVVTGEGVAQVAPFWSCAPCQPGDPVSMSSSLTLAGSEGVGTATVNGATYQPVYWVGQLDFSSGTATAAYDATISHAFLFSGWLRGYLSADLSGTPLYDQSYVGSGTAYLSFFRESISGPNAEVKSILYEFSDPTVTPEPATLVLLGSGLAGVIAARRRRRDASRC